MNFPFSETSSHVETDDRSLSKADLAYFHAHLFSVLDFLGTYARAWGQRCPSTCEGERYIMSREFELRLMIFSQRTFWSEAAPRLPF